MSKKHITINIEKMVDRIIINDSKKTFQEIEKELKDTFEKVLKSAEDAAFGYTPNAARREIKQQIIEKTKELNELLFKAEKIGLGFEILPINKAENLKRFINIEVGKIELENQAAHTNLQSRQPFLTPDLDYRYEFLKRL